MPAYDSVTAVMNIGKADAGYRIGRMYDGMVADIDGYMMDVAGTVLEKHQITGLQFLFTHKLAVHRLGLRKMRQRDPISGIDQHGKSGAVTAVRKTLASPYIRVSHELACIIHQFLADRSLYIYGMVT